MKPFLYALQVLFLVTGLSNCLLDGSFKHRSTSVPDQLDDGWMVSSPAGEGMDPQILEEAYDMFYSDEQFINALALLVVHNGKIVFETYARSPEDRERLHHVQSVTKSVTSLVFGAVRKAGYLDDLDETVASIIPEAFVNVPDKQGITLRHLLTMRSGIAFYNEDFSVEIHVNRPNDPVAHILSKPMYASPGEQFNYRDCDPHLLGAVVKKISGRNLEEWAVENLFSAIGITQYHWLTDPTRISTGAYGLYLKPRDLARIGQFVLQRGVWNTVEVIPSGWIDDSTSRQTDSGRIEYDYGYYWWIVPELNAVTAWGQGGNFIFLVPDKELVTVMISLPDVDDDTVGTVLPEFVPLARLICRSIP